MGRKKTYYAIEAKTFGKLNWIETLIMGQSTHAEVQEAIKTLREVKKEIIHSTGREYARKLTEDLLRE
jgi:hypothetical protein